MEKKLVRDYIFDASAQTVTASEFTSLRKIALITNVTTGDVIYDALDPALTATRSGTTLTLAYDTTAMSDTDELQILVRIVNDIDRIGYAKVLAGVDTDFYDLIRTGTGMGINQTGGNLVITAGTTARSESIIRSKRSYSGGIRMRTHHLLSQRVANQQCFLELVDVVGDGLAYTISSATALVVTFPTGHGFTSQNVGQFVSIGNFSGTGTFLSGRYAIASVSGDNVTFTVSGFAVGSGTCSAFGWNFYRLEYSGTGATSVLFDTARNGWSLGNTTATINTTASPGHMAIITGNDGVASFQDQLVASAATIQTTNRASRATAVPDDSNLYYQIRVVNGATAPTATTWTIGQSSIALYEPQSVVIQDVRPVGAATAIPVDVLRSVTTGTQPVSIAAAVSCQIISTAPIADVVSAAITTTTTTAAFNPSASMGYQLSIPVTAVSGTNPLLVITIEESLNSGTNWFPRCTFRCAATETATSTAVGIYYSPYLKLKGNRVRYTQTITGTTPSITRAINRFQGQSDIGEGVPYKLISAATTNATLVKTGPTTISMLTGSNTNAAVRYLKVYDKATAPTVGTDPVAYTFVLPGATTGAGSNVPLARELNLIRGFGLALTTGVADTDTGAVALNENIINCQIS